MALPQTSRWRFPLWLLTGIAAVVVTWPLDTPVDGALKAAQAGSLHQIAWWCSKLGEGWVPAAVGVVLIGLCMRLNRPFAAGKILFIVLACELTGLAGLILRILTGRTRPLAEAPQGFYGLCYHGHWIIGKYQFSSFPSGHAATAVGLAAAVWLCHRGWGMIAVLYALAVMWSRIALQCHHLTDVVASTFLAIPLTILLKEKLYPFIEFRAIQRALRSKSE